jgi:hypothetical protein
MDDPLAGTLEVVRLAKYLFLLPNIGITLHTPFPKLLASALRSMATLIIMGFSCGDVWDS